MNIEVVRNDIMSKKGQCFNFKINAARNQSFEFKGKIIETYPSIFIVSLVNENRKKSFSYSDLITESVVISQILV